MNLENRRGYSLTKTHNAILQKMKENCKVSWNLEKQLKNLSLETEGLLEKAYELPDGQVITMGFDTCIKCPEIIFNPSISGSEICGLHELIYNCIMASDEDIQQNLCTNIVLSGGNMKFPSITQRLENELSTLHLPHVARVMACDYNDAAWVGASILSTLCHFYGYWVDIREYNESGPRALNKRCPP